MVRLINRNNAVSLMYISYGVGSSLQGTTPIDPSPWSFSFGYLIYPLPSVSSNQYTTILTNVYSIEDVGNIELIDIGLLGDFIYRGNGLMRWQISGDGGDTWSTMSEGSFNTGILTEDYIVASGLWISEIQPLENKLQLRIQGLANVGTADFMLYNDSRLFITYRERILF